MRDLILKMSISLDGFVAGADGDIEWMFGSDDAARAWSVETLWNASLHIMGSHTFEVMTAYWPTATGEFAPPMNQIPKAVFTRQGPAGIARANTAAGQGDSRADAAIGSPTARQPGLPVQLAALQPGASSWAAATIASGNLAAEIATLKAHPGKPIIAHGGASFARSLVAAGLVDQFTLLVHPVALGHGLPLFSGLAAPTRFELISSTAFPGGSVAQIYRVE